MFFLCMLQHNTVLSIYHTPYQGCSYLIWGIADLYWGMFLSNHLATALLHVLEKTFCCSRSEIRVCACVEKSFAFF